MFAPAGQNGRKVIPWCRSTRRLPECLSPGDGALLSDAVSVKVCYMASYNPNYCQVSGRGYYNHHSHSMYCFESFMMKAYCGFGSLRLKQKRLHCWHLAELYRTHPVSIKYDWPIRFISIIHLLQCLLCPWQQARLLFPGFPVLGIQFYYYYRLNTAHYSKFKCMTAVPWDLLSLYCCPVVQVLISLQKTGLVSNLRHFLLLLFIYLFILDAVVNEMIS